MTETSETLTQNTHTAALSDAGVSLWLDDLSRDRLVGGGLKDLTVTRNIVGVTTNPSIFQAAIGGSTTYDDDVKALAAEGADAEAVVRRLTTDDVRNAADVLRGVYDATDGEDGRVSIEVDPRLAHETQGTIDQAVELWETVDRPNVFIKIPATAEGLPAITEVIGKGISVNVTLIFSLERYTEVVEAYIAGLEKAKAAGILPSTIRSVASVFVSRVDTEIDKRLEGIGTEDALALRGQSGLANADLIHRAYGELHGGDRFLAIEGAHPQRALWASTGVKNPDYVDTMYVDRLVAPGVVNTVPEKTLEAVADHSVFDGHLLDAQDYAQAEKVLAAVADAGVDLDDVWGVLEDEGVEKFITAWNSLLGTVSEQIAAA